MFLFLQNRSEIQIYLVTIWCCHLLFVEKVMMANIQGKDALTIQLNAEEAENVIKHEKGIDN